MKRTHWGQHGEDCFGCRVQTVSIAASAMPTRSPQAVQLENRERRWSRDMDAYSRLRRDHVQPRKIDGSADLEIRSSEKYEVEHGMVSPNPTARKRTSKILSEPGASVTTINHTFSATDFMGYGVCALGIDKGLHLNGVETHMEDQLGHDGPLCEAALWTMPPSHVRRFKQEQRRYSLTMWEATLLPPTFTENVHEFTTVIVPSKQNVELFSERHNDVRLCPLGIDPDTWKPTPRRMITNRFNFLICGAGTRKGVDIAIKAFAAAFQDYHYDIEPWLIIKCPVKWNQPVPPRTEVIQAIVPTEEMVAIYADAHCYVGPSRGEGWGMQPLQAMAQGMPTILSDAHGHSEFSHLGIPIPCGLSKAGMFLYGDAGTWWEPDHDSLVETMRDVYENYEQHRVRAVEAAKVVQAEFTWQKTAERITEIMGTSQPIETGEWFMSRGRKYLTRVTQSIQPSIAGVRYDLVPGNDFWMAPDARRVIQDAGLLDDTCLSDMVGRLDAPEPVTV